MSTKWTAADIPDQSGRVAVVTGANSGLGLVTARELARAGARVVLACRDERRGEQAAADFTGEVEVRRLDLADLSSVRDFAEALGRRYDGLDLLINNAGVMALPPRKTADGFEMQFGTNHLGHFALTGRLLALLAGKDRSRVVTLSSGLHRIGKINFADLQGERRYGKWSAYGQSKLANLMFAVELDRRLAKVGGPTRSYAAHPGYAATNLQGAAAKMTGSALQERIVKLGNVLLAQDAGMGALPSLYAATAPDLPGGSYIGPDRLFEQRGHPKVTRGIKAVYDETTARRLWEVSEELTHVRYEFAS
jgi:NAD(P)-dependent dehydrogenase (short-subunit alcohol dehydrogenase family)